MNAWFSTLVLAVTLVLPQTSHAVTIFSDNFDAAPIALNAPFTHLGSQWAVSNGTVDVIGPGLFDLLPGNGRYVDLDGSSGDAGILRSITPLSIPAGSAIILSFSLAGSQRGDTNSVTFGLDLNSDGIVDNPGTITVASNETFQTFSQSYTVVSSTSNARIQFGQSGGDNLGALLDNVTLDVQSSAVPEPNSLLLLGAGLAGIAAWRRRQLQ